ncbi:DHA2 family efflux MFS transporter permease subunit [Kordiimonas marina]|uniref:DHA2 family efflux MFS transporter permease subunit n=1 Tax=Kordiimonas marina TaxID=2872312 RepID=UPI001FF6F288|nr:DHA2 family efflux MFS transporter permease subunit [Kordiimonas marina]MCJ9429639.1 DHA2 family efflux MFS transporter permease subunit [Kordiimonas marina]
MSAAEATKDGGAIRLPSITLQGGTLAAAIVLLALSNFMVVLDMTIVNVAVPHIAGGLAVSPNEGTWVITSYVVAEAIMVPLSGWLANRFGTVRVFVTSALLFGLASALCGFASSIETLVAFRILQGLSGGPIMPMSQALLMRVTPKEKVNVALGLYTMTMIVGPVVGPLLGGTIADTIGWPWAFYINVPVAIVCSVFAWNLFIARETPTNKVPIDFIGLMLLVFWVGSMQMMLDTGESHDWFASPMIIALALCAAIGFVMFLIWEVGEDHPVVDLRIFRNRSFALSCVSVILAFGAFFATVVLVPLWLQLNMGYTATEAGHIMAFNGLFGIFMSPVAAMLLSRVDPRALMSYGMSIMAIATLYRITFAPNMTFWQMVPPQLAVGLGMPFFFIPIMGMSMATLKPEEMASGAGMFGFVRTTSAGFATALITTMWQDATIDSRSDMVGSLNGAEKAMAKMQSMGMLPEQARHFLDSMVQSQAVMAATNHIFLILGLLFVVTALGVWLLPKPKGPLSVGPGH